MRSYVYLVLSGLGKIDAIYDNEKLSIQGIVAKGEDMAEDRLGFAAQ